MNSKPVTKIELIEILDKRDKKQDKKWDKRLDQKLKIALNKQKREIISETAAFFQSSIVPILDKILARLDSIESIADNHERRIEKNENKLLNHEQRISSLEKPALSI